MQPSRELKDLVLSVADRSCELLFQTDGPLQPTIVVETVAGEQRVIPCKEIPKSPQLIAAASSGGVLRLVAAMTGLQRRPGGAETPLLLLSAFERGDVSGYVMVQRFAAGTEPRFLQIEGKLEIVQREPPVFTRAPFALASDRRATEGWVQGAFARFARRVAAAAGEDAAADASDVQLALVAGQDRAAGSFRFRHSGGAQVRLEVDYRDNVFVPKRLLQLVGEQFVPIDMELGQQILRVLAG